jgi:hypothetical protein
MMWEVAGGIVIAVLILRFWPLIIGAALFIVVIGVVAALGYLAWWGLTSGTLQAFIAAHPLACFGAIVLIIAAIWAFENRHVLSRMRLPNMRPAFVREYPALSRLLLFFLYSAALITIGIVTDAFNKHETQRSVSDSAGNRQSPPQVAPQTARKNVFEDIISAADELFNAAPNPSDRFDAPGNGGSGNKSVEHGPWEDYQRAAPQPATAPAAKMSLSLQGRIDSYTVEHYRKCWATALSMNAMTYVPRVEFRLARAGELEGEPRLLNPSSNPVEKARGEQALAAVRRCSPMQIPAEFTPFYDYWRVTELDMKEDMP